MEVTYCIHAERDAAPRNTHQNWAANGEADREADIERIRQRATTHAAVDRAQFRGGRGARHALPGYKCVDGYGDRTDRSARPVDYDRMWADMHLGREGKLDATSAGRLGE